MKRTATAVLMAAITVVAACSKRVPHGGEGSSPPPRIEVTVARAELGARSSGVVNVTGSLAPDEPPP
jgi:hypothetical protein